MDYGNKQPKKTLDTKIKKALGSIIKKEINNDNPYQLKVDCNTALEYFFLVAGIVVAIIFIPGIIIAFEEKVLWPYVWGSLFLSLFLFGCRAVTDNYYVLDKQQYKILIHRSFAGIKSEIPICEFNQVFAVLPVAKMQTSKTLTYWTYYLAVLLQSGRFIRISDANITTLPEVLSGPGKEIAEWIGVPFIPGREKKQIKIITKPVMDEGCLEYIGEKELKKKYLKLALLIVAISMILPLLIIFLLDNMKLF